MLYSDGHISEMVTPGPAGANVWISDIKYMHLRSFVLQLSLKERVGDINIYIEVEYARISKLGSANFH